MATAVEALHTSLSAIVGADFVQSAMPADMIDGVQPRLVVAPGSADEAAQVLRAANEAGAKVAPRGNGTKLGWGHAPSAIDVVLSLRRLDQVVEHAWGDMTATVQAGCTVARLQQVLAEHRQHLALDPLWPSKATIGGVLATDDSGARRIRFGALRDLVLGMTIALPDGTLARSGGKVVKNVAGYDLPKLMTGALGTLGVIVEATFRLYPLPSNAVTLSIGMETPAVANALVLAILDSTLTPTGVQVRAHSHRPPEVDVRFEGIADAIEAQVAQLHTIAARISGVRGIGAAMPAIWQAREALWGRSVSLVCKVSVVPAQLSAVGEAVQRVATALRLDWELIMQALGVGLLRLDGANGEVLLAALTILRQELVQPGGALVVLQCPPALKGRVDVWSLAAAAVPLMRRVKDQFDPENTLNPDRLLRS